MLSNSKDRAHKSPCSKYAGKPRDDAPVRPAAAAKGAVQIGVARGIRIDDVARRKDDSKVAHIVACQRSPGPTETVFLSGDTVISLRWARSTVTPSWMLDPPGKAVWPAPLTEKGALRDASVFVMWDTWRVDRGVTKHCGRSAD
ncbi:uncharacterized protein MAM_05531 [Metarhizium album ARSEF 1941]|uniref:Uncharacterized protein n=1 Tax=Metarhizium album (strain ARSEF 1941) TaxID=1081103 RepID=A0A0B2WRE3_METAS|nr:uncharacterized protein MAM_05531 [Metarhizium album ARSEF 1941]KHN96588.1 hypothetical protein MAM_05531 [Metarhizium album ARSEF 1941]